MIKRTSTQCVFLRLGYSIRSQGYSREKNNRVLRRMHNRYISEFVLVLVVFCMAAPLVAADVDKWESAIAAFETDDQKNVYPNNSIMFVGSSSIRLWETLAEDMAPYDIIQRGFGGATTVDVVYYTNRILGDHHLQSIVLFVANDIRGKEHDDLSPEQAVGYFEQF